MTTPYTESRAEADVTDGPFGVYLRHCLVCGCALAHVARTDDVDCGCVVISDGLCLACSIRLPSSPYHANPADFIDSPEQRRLNAEKVGLPREWLGDDGYVLPQFYDAFTERAREMFGTKRTTHDA